MSRMIVKAIMAAALLSGCATAAGGAESPPAQAALQPPLENLMEIVGDANTVVFGEDSHGMMAVHQIVPQIFRPLVEQKGFRVFVFEVQWGIPEGLADFMNSDRTELNAVDSYWLNGAFASQPIADMLVWIRNWNRAHPDDRIMIAGYQGEQPVSDFRALFAFLQQAAPGEVERLRQAVAPCRAADQATYPGDLDFMNSVFSLTRARTPSYTDAQRAACLAGLDAIESVVSAASSAPARERTRARLHLISLRNFVAVLRRSADLAVTNPNMSPAEQTRLSGEMYAGGDLTRFRIYQGLLELDFPGRKIFHWMHNWHAMRHSSETGDIAGANLAIPRGTVSFGERLAQAEGRREVVIGNIVPCGTTCEEPADSLEPAFVRAFGDRPALIDLHRTHRSDLPLDRPGSLYANHHRGGFTNVVLRRQFDAMLYIPSSAMVGR